MKKLMLLGLVAAAGGAQAVELYSNGPVVDAAGLSILTAPASSLGATSNATQTLADNFSFAGAAWNVASLDFFAYQTSAVGFTFTSVSWSIRAGADINAGSIVASGTAAVTNGGLVGYRASSTTPTNTQRAIYRISADIPDVSLTAGSYFVTWALAGTSASGPFVPPVLGSLGTGNSLFLGGSNTTFLPVTDGGSLQTFDVPFAIQGSVVPEPGTVALMLAGGLAVLSLTRRRSRQS